LAIVIEEEVAFEGGAGRGEAVDAFEFLALRVEGGYFEYVLEEGDAGGGCGCHFVVVVVVLRCVVDGSESLCVCVCADIYNVVFML